MKKAVVVLAHGFEEIEAINVIDILRRAGVEAISAGLDSEAVEGAHGVKIYTDTMLDKINQRDFDMIVLPGGLPGAQNLSDSKELSALLREFKTAGKFIAAICAAPMALGSAGVLGDVFTCYPGFEPNVRADKSGYNPSQNVVIDSNIITSRGPATAMEFALELARILCGDKTYAELKNGLLFVG